MSASILLSANPAKGKLIEVLSEMRELEFTQADIHLSEDKQYDHYEKQERIFNEKRRRLERYVATLERINERWLEFLQKLPPNQHDEENDRYAAMANDNTGILKLIENGWDAQITLTMHTEDAQTAMRRLQESLVQTNRSNAGSDQITSQQEDESREVNCQLTVKLPLLTLRCFDGDPKQWREFWSGFNAAVNQQNLPDVQKLTYLLSCLKGAALRSVEGYEVAPENYETIRDILMERFGSPFIIKRALYRELQSIKRNDRDLRITVEAIERVLRQLTNLGENVEQTSIELTIEEKLPHWVLEEVYKEKEMDSRWSVSKLRQLLEIIVKRKEAINQAQRPIVAANEMKYDQTTRIKRTYFDQARETSALAAVQSEENRLNRKIIPNRRSRSCAFCNRDHWDDECQTYAIVKERLMLLTSLKACKNCLKVGHNITDCKVNPKRCFHCKNNHNSALCHVFQRGEQLQQSKLTTICECGTKTGRFNNNEQRCNRS